MTPSIQLHLEPYFNNLEAELGNLEAAREIIEAMHKGIEISLSISAEEIGQACCVFKDFLAHHARYQTINFTSRIDVEYLQARFAEEHQLELSPYLSRFIGHLIRYPHDEDCKRHCLDFVIALCLMEEIRQEKTLAQEEALAELRDRTLINYYTLAFKLAQDDPDYLSILRETSSRLLFRALRKSFHQHADIQNLRLYVDAIDRLCSQAVASPSDLCKACTLCSELIVNSKIPPELNESSFDLGIRIQNQMICLRSETSPQTSFIEQGQQALAAFREEFCQAFETLSFNPMPNVAQTRQFQKERFEALRRFFIERLTQSPLFAFELSELPPHEIRAVGSVGRQEMGPFSDLECFVLLKERKPLLQRALLLLQLGVLAMGETKVDLPDIQGSFFKKGFCLDPLDPSEGVLLLDTPEGLARAQIERGGNSYTQERYQLLRSSRLVGNAPELFEIYSAEVNETLHFIPEPAFLDHFRQPVPSIPLHEKRALHFLEKLREDFSLCQPLEQLTVVDIKERFLAPLYYLIHSLGIYFDIEETNTLDIVDRLHEKMFFDGDSAKLIKEVVAAIYMIRVRLHLVNWEARDEALLRPPSNPETMAIPVLTEQEQQWLSYAEWLVLQPLYQGLETASGSIDLLAKLRRKAIPSHYGENNPVWIAQIKAYMSYLATTGNREGIETLYRTFSQEIHLEPLRYLLFSHCGNSDLSSIPNRQTGFRYSYLEQFQELKNRLFGMTLSAEEMALRDDPGKVSISFSQWGEELIPLVGCGQSNTPETTTRYLHPDLPYYLLDPQVKERALAGLIEERESTLWLRRQSPHSLHRVVSLSRNEGFGLHFKERPTHPAMEFAIVSLLNRLFGRGATPTLMAKLTIELSGRSYTTAVALSLSQAGEPFNRWLQNKQSLDPEQYTEQLIAQVLILPTDAHGSNFLVTKQNQLIALDLEASFIPLRLGQTNEIDFVSELFCHDLIPFLSPEVMRRFLSVQTNSLLTAWLNELLDVQGGWSPLLAEEKDWLLQPLYDAQDPLNKVQPTRDQRCLVQCLIPPGTVARLYQQITHLKQVFERHLNNNTPLTPLQLLEQIISCWDERTHEIGKQIAKRYQDSRKILLWIERAAEHRLAAATGKSIHYSQASSITLQSLIGHFPNSKDLLDQLYHPQEALKELAAISCLYEQGVQLSSKKGGMEIKLDKNHQLNLESQRMLLKLIEFSQNLFHLTLPYFDVLDNATLNQLLVKHGANLKSIQLMGCQKITCNPLVRHAARLEQLEELILSGDQLEDLAFADGSSVYFPKLKKLVVHESTRVALSAPLLKHVNLSRVKQFDWVGQQLKSFLWIGASFTNERLEQILGSNANLRVLGIRGSYSVSCLPPHEKLETIDMSRTSIHELAGRYPTLKQLRAHHCHQLSIINIESPDLETIEARHCVKLVQLQTGSASLQKLLLQGCSLTPENLGLFNYPRLRFLNLSENSNIETNDVQTILERLPELEELFLDDCPKLNGAYGALRATQSLTNLRILSLKNDAIYNLEMDAPNVRELILKEGLILASPFVKKPQLTIVDLSDSMTIMTGSRAVLKRAANISESAVKIITLNLNEGDDLPVLIQQWTTLQNSYFKLSCKLSLNKLKQLLENLPRELFEFKVVVRGNIGNEGIEALIRLLPQRGITQLNLWNNNIGNKGAQALARVLHQTGITQLNLGNNDLGKEGAQAIAQVLHQTGINQLNLSDNNIGKEGAQTLTQTLPQSCITQLGLRNNNIGKEGAQALTQVLPQSNITQLDFSWNGIGNKGAQALAQVLPQKSITLYLNYNNLDEQTKQMLKEVQSQYPQIKIDL